MLYGLIDVLIDVMCFFACSLGGHSRLDLRFWSLQNQFLGLLLPGPLALLQDQAQRQGHGEQGGRYFQREQVANASSSQHAIAAEVVVAAGGQAERARP